MLNGAADYTRLLTFAANGRTATYAGSNPKIGATARYVVNKQ